MKSNIGITEGNKQSFEEVDDMLGNVAERIRFVGHDAFAILPSFLQLIHLNFSLS